MDVGVIVERAGFFSLASYFRGVTPEEVERRVGYRPGRLRSGWHLLFLLDLPTEDQFEFRGYSHMSGGVPMGHLASPPDPRNSEKRLQEDGYNVLLLKKRAIGRFSLIGPKRIAKALPVNPELGEDDYPPGSGIPQWTLTASKPFRVAAFVGPRQKYMGDYR